VIESLPGKHEALSLNPSTGKKKKKTGGGFESTLEPRASKAVGLFFKRGEKSGV
jgi:hypothetical protein